MVTNEQITNLGKLLPHEWDEFRNLQDSWAKAKNTKDYVDADRLRAEIFQWDSMLGTDKDFWHPAFESNEHRTKRALERVQTYKMDIYPFEYLLPIYQNEYKDETT